MDKSRLSEPVISKTFNKVITDLITNGTLIIQDKKSYVLVNGQRISNHTAKWWYKNLSFHMKKSAVAYAICMASNQRKLAQDILYYDNTYGKIQEDVNFYKYNVRVSNNNTRRNILLNRLSNDLPKLSYARNMLNDSLRNVLIA